MPTHIEQELGIAPTTNRIRRWFLRFLPIADRSLDPLTVNYEVWRAIKRSVRKWPTYREAPNYIEVMVSPEDWEDYWGVDTVRKEAGVSTYVKARIIERGLWVAGEPQIMVFEDETIEMGELDVVCQFVEPMSKDEIATLRASVGRTPSRLDNVDRSLTDGGLDSTIEDDYGFEGDAYDEQGADVEVLAVDVVDARFEHVDNALDQNVQNQDLWANAKLELEDISMEDVSLPGAGSSLMETVEAEEVFKQEGASEEAGFYGDDAFEEDVPREDAPGEEDVPEDSIPLANALEEVPLEEEVLEEEAPEEAVGEDQEDNNAEVADYDLPEIPSEADEIAEGIADEVGIDVELSGRHVSHAGPARRPNPTVRFVDENHPGSLYLVGDGSFRLEIHSGDCIGAVRLGESVPAQVNVRLDADGFPYAETMQCTIRVVGGRWCVENHAVHGTRVTKFDGTRYLLGHSDPCALDQGDVLWLGHEKPLRVEY